MRRDEAYEVLGLSPPVSDEDIQQAYRELTKRYHPDVTDGETREEFIRIKDARDRLIGRGGGTRTRSNAKSKTTTSTTTDQSRSTSSSRSTGASSSSTGTSTTNDSKKDSGTTKSGSDATGRGASDGRTGSSTTESQQSGGATSRTSDAENETREDDGGSDSDSDSENSENGGGVDEPSRGHRVYCIDFASIEESLCGKTVELTGCVKQVRASGVDGVEYTCTFFENRNGSAGEKTVTVYVWADIGHHSMLAGGQEFNLTGVLRKDWKGTGWELHVTRIDDLNRVQQQTTTDSQASTTESTNTTSTSSDTTETTSSSDTGDSETTNASRDSSADTREQWSVTNVVGGVVLSGLGALLAPAKVITRTVPWYVQIVVLLGYVYGVPLPTMVADAVTVLIFAYLPAGGAIILVNAAFGFILGGNAQYALISVGSAVCLAVFHTLFRDDKT